MSGYAPDVSEGRADRREERRSEPVTFRTRPSLRAAVERDRLEKGQPLVEWMERAILNALPAGAGPHGTPRTPSA
jgi:hypothetical protein